MNTKKAIKQGLFAFVFLLLATSYLQQKFDFAKLAVLEGYMEKTSWPSISLNTWLKGDYQKEMEKHVNQNIGFRPLLIRFRNQLMYSFFNETSSHIVIGKEQYLYEPNYIHAYLGHDFMGKDSIDRHIYQLQKIQDTLDALNVHFAIILAAGKGSFFPEYIPERYKPEIKTLSNYEYYLQKFKKSGIHHIDFNDWFVSMKPTSTYPLYPKYGIHWSKYGQKLVTDSILDYIEKKLAVSLPFISWDTIEISDTARDTDYDMGGAMNLFRKLPGYPLAYPKFRTLTDSNHVKPNTLVIGDSYYSSLFTYYLGKNVFNTSQFWFYNQQVYTTERVAPYSANDFNLKEEIEKQDVVFILSTEANLNRLGFGAIQQLYDAYYQPEVYYKSHVWRKKRIEYYKNKIRNNAEWLKEVGKKAKERNIDLESMIHLDAEYLTDLEKPVQ